LKQLNDYKEQIHLFEPIVRPPLLTTSEKTSVLTKLCNYFARECPQQIIVPETATEQRKLLRVLLNIRHPHTIPVETLKLLDSFLWTERIDSGVVEMACLKPAVDNLFLWHGDICRLDVDGIVNAANEKMLGCFQPLHSCIDNAIHSAAGPIVREDCHTIMSMQNKDEKTGGAKITRAYNLPSRFILHTVGPIVQESVEEIHKQLLASCYISCLDLAAETGKITSIAFCCVSTGVYGFPAPLAVPIVVETVRTWLLKNPGIIERIVFTVFTGNDYDLYYTYFDKAQ
jgi:O-acetyl-ADP-ribose deacetylase (regulator of RNase III)